MKISYCKRLLVAMKRILLQDTLQDTVGVLYKKDVPYNLCSNELCKFPSVNSQRYGISSLCFRGSLLWNALSDEVKLATSINNLKKEIQQWDGRNCKCHICI